MINDLIDYSFLQSNNRQRLGDLIPLNMPLSIYIDPTNYCNFKCTFCPRSFSDYRRYAGNPQHMDFKLYEKIISEIYEWGKLKVLRLYYLGEPFINPNFIQMVNVLEKYPICERLEITTNGTFLNDRNCSALVHAAHKLIFPIYIRISIYSVFQEKHSLLTKSKISIDEILRNVANLRKIRDSMRLTNLYIYAKMIDSLCEENELFTSRYADIVDEVCIEEAMNWSGYDNRNLIGNLYGDKRKNLTASQELRKICPYPFYTLVINSDGDVVSCCVDWSRKTKLGNVRSQSLQEIWHGEYLKSFQDMHLHGMRCVNDACRNCTFLNGCPDMDDLDYLLKI